MKVNNKILPQKNTIQDAAVHLYKDHNNVYYMCKISLGHSFINCIILEEDKVIEIVDIQCETIKDGIGSLMMEKLISYASENNYCKIVGWLSIVDEEHIDRLRHFYIKHGFTIKTEYDGMKLADIELFIT